MTFELETNVFGHAPRLIDITCKKAEVIYIRESVVIEVEAAVCV
jgi:hypothetical protein